MSSEQMQSAMKELQESMAVLARIDKMQSVSPDAVQESIESEKLQRRIQKNLAEISEKLNRLIGPQ
jgi:endonuclease III